ncbi:MAG: hypothetical protein JSR21_13415 [Proteobacteria bacterium]|nr:hypothetical protein [Pseudomonadota bacterium]
MWLLGKDEHGYDPHPTRQAVLRSEVYNLVLVFGSDNVMTRHALVQTVMPAVK